MRNLLDNFSFFGKFHTLFWFFSRNMEFSIHLIPISSEIPFTNIRITLIAIWHMDTTCERLCFLAGCINACVDITALTKKTGLSIVRINFILLWNRLHVYCKMVLRTIKFVSLVTH